MFVGCGLSKRRVFTAGLNGHSKTIFNGVTETVKANNYKVETHSRGFFNSLKNSLRIIKVLGLVAQSVEQRIENPLLEWPKKQVSSLSQASTPLGVEVRSSSLASTAIEPVAITIKLANGVVNKIKKTPEAAPTLFLNLQLHIAVLYCRYFVEYHNY